MQGHERDNQVVCKTMEDSIQMGPHMEPILQRYVVS